MFDSSLDIFKLIMVARNFEVNIEAVAQRCSVKLYLQLYLKRGSGTGVFP